MATIPTGLRKALLYTTILLFCFIIIHFGIRSSEQQFRSAKHWSTLINDPRLQLRGLVYALKNHPEQLLPEIEDGALFTPYALGIEEHFSPRDWSAKLKAMENRHPLVVFSKTYCPYSKGAKELLEQYDLDPQPLIFEVNLRNDSALIKSYLTRLTGRSTFPNVILRAKSLGGFDDIREHHDRHELRDMLEDGGLTVRGAAVQP